jgi:predicted phosphodiesterase
METLLLGDLHFQNPSYNFITDRALSRVFTEQIWPFVKERKIKRVFQLGDFTHDKKQINKQTAQLINECFTIPAEELGLEVILICGNHDSYFRDRNNVNSLRTLFTGKKNFRITDTEPQVLDNMVFVPWGFNPKNYKSKYCFTHADVNGFEYQKGVVSKSGFDQQDLEFFTFVYAGHFHRKSLKKNMMYLGSLIALNFGEVDSEHGFGVFDNETGKFEFVETKVEVFKKIKYPSQKEITNQDFTDKVVSIIVEKQDEGYEKFIDNIYQQKPAEVKILNMESNLKSIMQLDTVEEVENILSLSKKYIEGMELQKPIDQKILFEIFQKTYEEAMI